jgi:tyrosyl-tRNA synthetase
VSDDGAEQLHPDDERALELLTAGTAEVLPQGGLAARLAAAGRAGRPLRVKLGIDPSGSDLTLGHAVVLRKLRQFQDTGHLAVLIVGDFTGMVGDPSDKKALRQSLTAEQTAQNSATYVDQVLRILRPDRTELRRNSEWLASMTMSEVVREARHLTVAQLLEREDFARRFAARQPISLVEFLYPLLQGYDSVAVRADVELGGTDQTYNLLVGRELQRVHGQPQQVVVTLPLLEGLDGRQKMSKSLGNYVAIAEPPDQQFGKLMSLRDDRLVGRYLQLCTDLPPEEITLLETHARGGGAEAAAAKRRMAREVVALYHGPEAAAAAEQRFTTVFREHRLPTQIRAAALVAGDPVHLPAAMVAAGLTASSSEGRRLLRAGAVRLDNEPLPSETLDLARADLVGRVLAAGRKKMARLVEPDGADRGDSTA